MSEVKPRKKGLSTGKTSEGLQKAEKHSNSGQLASPRTSSNPSSFWMDSRTSLSVISLAVCLLLTWALFHQSSRFADLEKKYSFLQREAEKFLDAEHKVNLISEKLESSENTLLEAASSVSLMTEFEHEVSSLRKVLQGIEGSERAVSMKMQSADEKLQNVTRSWRSSWDEIHANTSGLKSEAKLIHTEVTSRINDVDQRVKALSERVGDLEDSTARNIRTLERQEEDEFSRLKLKLDLHAEALEKLEEQQESLAAEDTDLSQKLANYEPKIEECKAHLPAIERAVHSILRSASELLRMERKIKDLARQLGTVESDALQTRSDTMVVQRVLEGTRYSHSLFK
ncbi:IKIP protein, partial [Upupa epops]|nr:IKIP protein [Upupa epops]